MFFGGIDLKQWDYSANVNTGQTYVNINFKYIFNLALNVAHMNFPKHDNLNLLFIYLNCVIAGKNGLAYEQSAEKCRQNMLSTVYFASKFKHIF